MSRDVKQYWQELRAIQATLPEFVWLASAGPDSAAFVTETSAVSAARLLLAKSHRIATEAEIERHLGREQEMLRVERVEQQRREGVATVVVKRKK